MKKIIFLGEKTYSLRNEHGLHCINKDKEEIVKEYYNLNNKNIEVIYIKKKKDLLRIKNIHEDDAIIIPIKDKSDNIFYDFIGNIYYLYNIDEEFIFNSEEIIMVLSMLEKKSKKKVPCNMLGVGFGEFPISCIVIQILKRINLLENSSRCYLKLLLGKELNIEEISYLEDPLLEYLSEGVELQITQEVNDKIKDKIYFSLIGE